MQCREAVAADLERILQVHRLAFGRDDEAELVARLMRDETARPLLSCLSEQGGVVLGHVLFTALRLVRPESQLVCAILAPLAVLPDRQRTGIGRQLVEFGCERLRTRGSSLVFVLGDPRYYTRCGFEPAVPHGLHAPYPITPEEAWMVRPLAPHVLGRVHGTVACARSLQAEEYWRE